MQPTKALFCALILVGCFQDTGDSIDTGDTDTGTSSDPQDGTTAEDTTESKITTESEETDTSTGTVTDDATKSTADQDTTETNSATTDTGTGQCGSYEIPLDEPFEAAEMRSLYVDFDEVPGVDGQEPEPWVCLRFETVNSMSARTIWIGGEDGENVGVGPCYPNLDGVFEICKPYTKPSGVTEVMIDNTAPGPGCQTWEMHDVTLRFTCAF
jgi:hypothetical protein